MNEAYYRDVLGFEFGEPWGGFYAIGARDGIEALYDRCVDNGANILKPLAATAWGTKDFYIEDPEGYIIAFGPSIASARRENRGSRR